MFTHVMVGCNDKEKAIAFYDPVLATLDIHGTGGFYSKDGFFFGVGTPANKEPATHANGGTIGFKAISQQQVDAFHTAGIANGGTCEGPPGPRSMANSYGAYLRDPDGNKICAFFMAEEKK